MKTTMIVTGGLSGGISAAIAGGNFWDGFKQGIISAGLNHVAHVTIEKIEDLSLKEQLRRAHYTWDGKPDFSPEGIARMIASVPELKRFFDLTGGKAKIETIEYIPSENPNEIINSVTTGYNVLIYRLANSNNYLLALTLGHEMIHVYHNINYRMDWRRVYNDDSGKRASYISEVEAYSWEFKMGNDNAFFGINRNIYELRDIFKIVYKPKDIY